jgi:hypothetical protein
VPHGNFKVKAFNYETLEMSSAVADVLCNVEKLKTDLTIKNCQMYV